MFRGRHRYIETSALLCALIFVLTKLCFFRVSPVEEERLPVSQSKAVSAGEQIIVPDQDLGRFGNSIEILDTELSFFRDQFVAAFAADDLEQVLWLLADLSPENLDEVLGVFHDLPIEGEYREAFKALFYRWGQFDPRRALEYGLGRENHRMPQWYAAVDRAMLAWAENDIESAEHFLETLQDDDWDVKRLTDTFVRTMAKESLSGAMNWSGTQENLVIQEQAMFAVSLLHAGDLSHDSASLLEMLRENSFKPSTQSASAIWARERVAVDVSSGLAVIERMPQGAVRNAAFEAFFNQWALIDSDASAAFLNQHENRAEIEHGIAGYVEAIYRGYPEAGLHWAQALESNSALKQTLIAKIEAYHWNREDLR